MSRRAKESIQGCFRRLVAELVGYPDELRLHVEEKPIGVSVGLVVSMEVHQTDYRRVIGRRGTNFRALAAVAAQIADLHRTQIKLAPLCDPNGPTSYVPNRKDEPKIQFYPNCNWPAAIPQIDALARLCASQLFGDAHPYVAFNDIEGNRTCLTMKVKLAGRLRATAKDAADALAILFDSGSRKHGRIIELQIEVQEDPGEWQPSGDGRHSGMEER